MTKILTIIIFFLSFSVSAEKKYTFFGVELGEKINDKIKIKSNNPGGYELIIPQNFMDFYPEFHKLKIFRNTKNIVTKIQAINLQSFICMDNEILIYAQQYKENYNLEREEKTQDKDSYTHKLFFNEPFIIELKCTKTSMPQFFIDIFSN